MKGQRVDSPAHRYRSPNKRDWGDFPAHHRLYGRQREHDSTPYRFGRSSEGCLPRPRCVHTKVERLAKNTPECVSAPALRPQKTAASRGRNGGHHQASGMLAPRN